MEKESIPIRIKIFHSTLDLLRVPFSSRHFLGSYR